MSALRLNLKAQSSSSLKLESIPKIDKKHFISTFVDAQKLHSKLHAEEGRALWDNLETSHNRPQSENISGLITPVLVPRNPEASMTKTLKANAHIISTSPGNKKPKPEPKTQNKSNSTHEQSDHRKIQVTKNKGKKRAEQVSDDDEIAARLAERRDKKRMKREIVRPTDQTDNDPEKIETPAKKKAKATARKNSGLALMHGFTATNVGKNRLTVPPVLGVFNRGKASMKTQVRKKSYKANKSSAFLESVFLGETFKGPQTLPKPPSSTCSSSSEDEPAPASLVKPERTKKKPRFPTEDHSGSHALTSSSEEIVPDPVRAKSEEWIIEHDGESLPSTASISLEHQCSIVLPTHEYSWGKGKIEQTEAEGSQNKEPLANGQDLDSHISSSLAPSQSASQHGLSSRANRAPPGITSKYFLPKQPRHLYTTATARDTTMPSNLPSPVFGVLSQNHLLSGHDFIDRDSLCLQPELQTSQSFSAIQSPRHPSVISPANQPYISPYMKEEGWGDPIVFSDPAHFDEDPDATSPDQQIPSEPEVVSYDSVDYPLDFYIPPRVDAPPLLIDQLYDDDDSMGSFDEDNCAFVWSPLRLDYEEMAAEDECQDDHNFYDEPEDCTFCPQDYVDYDDLLTAQWQGDAAEHYLSEDDETALFEMDLYETDMMESRSERGVFNDVWTESEAGDVAMSTQETDLLECQSETDGEGMPRFLQGRELLLGFAGGPRQTAKRESGGRVSFAEADVARNLKGHWLPQKL